MKNKIIFKVLLVLMLLITLGLVGAATATGGDAGIISLNLLWGYFLVTFSVAAAVLCAIVGMVSAPAGIKMTALSVVLVGIIVGAAWAIASGNSYQIVNLGDGGFFGAEETVITEASVLVTYVAFGAAVFVALLSEFMGIVSTGVKKVTPATEE